MVEKPVTNSTAFFCRHCRIPLPSATTETASGPWAMAEGRPFPLGVTWLPMEQAYNFAIFSRHATGVELLFFREDLYERPVAILQFDSLRNKSGSVWHCRVSAAFVLDAKFYGYRVSGLNLEERFHRFDHNKLLLDPYARTVYFPPGHDRAAASAPGSTMGKAPLALLDECQCPFAWSNDNHPRHESELIIYELHVRGFTRHPSSGVPPEHRGTFQGVIDKIPHLSALGVTAVELMPVFQFDPQEGSYWGYMPLNFFAPHHAYSASPDHCGQRREFRRLVQALHAARIEVILDVVYNHTCEGNESGPNYSFKGVDNATYYWDSRSSADPYANFSGCGNTLNTSNPMVRRLVIDSLRYWVTEMHVDGFRFDLASILARNSDGSLNIDDPPIFAEIAGDPVLADVRLIAEPWDAGGAFLLGRQFPGSLWMQWNARYRDTIQRFVRGDSGLVGDLMTRLYGSSDLFPDDPGNALRPWQSVNYVSSHDGFTLYDLVSYSRRRNEANGHGNTDGAADFSHNCGVEGDVDLPEKVLRLRKQQVKNFICLLMLSNGTPMFRMGDEFLQTQGGNNNPYNQDNETTWLDWRRLGEHRDVFRFFKEMIAFRKAHPSIARSHFWREDIGWHGPEGPVDLSRSSRTIALFLSGRSLSDDDLYVLVNASDQPVKFAVEQGSPGQWKKFIDTAAESPHDIVEQGHPGIAVPDMLEISPRSVAVACQRM